jgi:hypothetical protein
MASTSSDAGSNPAPSPYIERNLTIADFIVWITGNESGNPGPSTKLRSIIGGPGAGKSTFVGQLINELDKRSDCIPFEKLDLANYHSVSLRHTLRGWLIGASDKARRKLSPPPVFMLDEVNFDEFVKELRQACGARVRVLVVVDSFDELTSTDQVEVESILQVLLSSNPSSETIKVIIARRDETRLIELLLRWEEEIFELHGLDVDAQVPAEQIRRRLQAGGAGLGPKPEPWESELDQVIADKALDEAGQKRLVERLSPSLTPNPYINLLLLRRALDKEESPDLLDADDYRACLNNYVARAGLSAEHASTLVALTTLFKEINLTKENDNTVTDDGTFVIEEYGGQGKEAETLSAFMNAGIITYGKGLRYQIDPGALRLCHLLA